MTVPSFLFFCVLVGEFGFRLLFGGGCIALCKCLFCDFMTDLSFLSRDRCFFRFGSIGALSVSSRLFCFRSDVWSSLLAVMFLDAGLCSGWYEYGARVGYSDVTVFAGLGWEVGNDCFFLSSTYIE